MITEPTVFIIGAGGSNPYGFPTGKELTESICKNYVDKLTNLLKKKKDDERRINIELEVANKFVTKFYDSKLNSIDLFLSNNPRFSDTGRRAITMEILDAERRFIGKGMHFPQDDWYKHLLNALVENLNGINGYKKLNELNKISFITFNYDRSLEHILSNGICNTYSSHSTEALAAFTEIPIYHVFGQTGFLGWQISPTTMNRQVDFGQDYHLDFIDKIKKDINIIYDYKDGLDDKIYNCISEANRIFFLGFGFLKENLKLLRIPELLRKEHKVFGTAKNFYEEEITRTKSRLNGKWIYQWL